MLQQMIESVDKAFEDTVDEEQKIDAIIDSCNVILNNYILLILNERNYRDAKVLQNIEGSQLMFPEHEEIKTSFCLLTLIEHAETTDEVINYIRDNSIIVKKDKKVLDEFFEMMQLKDRLLDDYSSRYLTRKIELSSLKAQVARQAAIARKEQRLKMKMLDEYCK